MYDLSTKGTYVSVALPIPMLTAVPLAGRICGTHYSHGG